MSEHDDDLRRLTVTGIQDRTGRVPRWLAVVGAVLLLWGAYYTYRYWDAEADGSGRRIPVIDDFLRRFSPWGEPE